MESDESFVGIDGCSNGWITVRWSSAGLTTQLAARWSDLNLAEAAAVGVDMPIGLSDSGPRACDLAARALLPPRRKSSVFPPPKRYMLGLPWAEANAAGKAREGKGLSRQAGNIAPKIAELDSAMTKAMQQRIYEIHPELVFHHLNAGAALTPKRDPAGRAERLRLLQYAGLPGLDGLFGLYPRKHVKPDDLLDAAACALAARRIALGDARRLPEGEPPRDSRDLRMEIWY
jgi:predicted RNase H-like nuclease